jgi:hypothetical protein
MRETAPEVFVSTLSSGSTSALYGEARSLYILEYNDRTAIRIKGVQIWR